MVKRFLMPLVAAIVVLAMVVPGCTQPAGYTLTMAADPAGSGLTTPGIGTHNVKGGATVEIRASGSTAGFSFSYWSSSPAGIIANVNAASTTFTVPEENVTITAHFVGYDTTPTGWQPVNIRFAIRSNLAPYPETGDWIADRLEELHDPDSRIGFAVERIYGTSPELWAYWGGTHPREGKSHIYTGGWISPTIPRDSGGVFDQFYTGRVMSFHPWTIYEALLEEYPALDDASEKLRFRRFSTMVERKALFQTVLWDAMEFSPRIWTVDVAGVNPFRKNVRVAGDAAGGIGDPSWVSTAHFHDNGTPLQPKMSGGPNELVMRIEVPDLFVESWNPVEGSAWSYDMLITRRALGDAAVTPDPGPGATGGLYWPHLVVKTEVTADQSLPISQTIPSAQWGDGLTLTKVAAADAALVPPDAAWTDWDPVGQKWITVKERETADPAWKRTALTKTRVVYTPDLWQIPLHDGNTLSPADFLMGMIVGFDRGKVASPVHDPAEKASVERTLNVLKGFQIVSLDPLTIDTWHDTWYLDVEWFTTRNWFPMYGTYGWTGFWHMVTVGWAAEADNTGSTGGLAAAFSKAKADEEEVWWMDYTKGAPEDFPGKLAAELTWARTSNFIPYRTAIQDVYTKFAVPVTLGAEITARWNGMQTFYNNHGHFWVGNGPYIIANAATDLDPIANSIILNKWADYPHDGYKWLRFIPETVNPGVVNTGAWMDKVIFTKEASHADAVAKLKLGLIDIFAHGVTDTVLLDEITRNLSSMKNFGGYRELTFNPYRDPVTFAPYFDGEFTDLNPFAVPKIREAMNYVLDRSYFVGVHLAGAGAPKYTALGTAFPDHALYYDDIIEPIEEKYAHDLATASEIIMAEMKAMGAELYFNPGLGRVVWHYQP